jgi:hypothetical protein
MSEPTADDLWNWLAECLTCGEVHTFHPAGSDPCGSCGKGITAPTWAAPDGHGYRPRLKNAYQMANLRAEWEATLMGDLTEEGVA